MTSFIAESHGHPLESSWIYVSRKVRQWIPEVFIVVKFIYVHTLSQQRHGNKTQSKHGKKNTKYMKTCTFIPTSNKLELVPNSIVLGSCLSMFEKKPFTALLLFVVVIINKTNCHAMVSTSKLSAG